MRIVAFGDTHTQHRNLSLPDGDVLVFSGDGEFRNALDLIRFNEWLAGLDYKMIIVIAGNHDFFCERFPNEVKNYLTKAVYLKDEEYSLPNGMTIWGSPMTPTFLNWAFMESEENLDQYHWSKILKNTDILLTRILQKQNPPVGPAGKISPRFFHACRGKTHLLHASFCPLKS